MANDREVIARIADRLDADHTWGPDCPKFPDCSCSDCHEFHLEERGKLNDFCEICTEIRCKRCEGTGFYDIKEKDGDCLECDGAGYKLT
jgi:hypothetical protein